MNFWTEEESNLLYNLWQDDMPVSHIRQHIPNRTKNSIISKAKKLGCKIRANPVKDPKVYAGKRTRVAKKSGTAFVITNKPVYKLGRTSIRDKCLSALPDKLIPFSDTKNHCLYIPHDDLMCCGREVTRRNPYCDAHMELLHKEDTQDA